MPEVSKAIRNCEGQAMIAGTLPPLGLKEQMEFRERVGREQKVLEAQRRLGREGWGAGGGGAHIPLFPDQLVLNLNQ